jgi:hypothetical protein
MRCRNHRFIPVAYRVYREKKTDKRREIKAWTPDAIA